jgi:hypothetical protein
MSSRMTIILRPYAKPPKSPNTGGLCRPQAVRRPQAVHRVGIHKLEEAKDASPPKVGGPGGPSSPNQVR